MSSINEDFVIALYDYQAKDPEELTIRKNESLTLLDGSGTWYKVRNKLMNVGLVPSNYVKCKGESLVNRIGFRFPGTKKSKLPPAGSGANTQIPNSHNHGDGDNRKMQQASAEKYVAKYSYSATQTDELDLVKGVVIDVISKEADGWWQGKNQEGKIGWFPSNYVEVSHEPNDLTGGGVVSRHGNGNSDARPVLEVVRALYPFKSDNSEELSFETGDLFDIIGKPPSDPEWYEGRSAEGRVGLIPRNYIETVPGAALAQPEASNYDDVTPDMIIGNNAHVEPVTRMAQPPSVNRFVGKMDSMMDKPWYFGTLKRTEAEKMLLSGAQSSQFMVRDSESTVGDLSVSMKAPDRIKHFKVSKRDGKYCIGQRKFDSVEDLIEHYRKAPIYTAPEVGKIYLTVPMPK